MVYEVLVLASVWLNALDTPRTLDSRLTQSLHRDGFSFFAVSARVFCRSATLITDGRLKLVTGQRSFENGAARVKN